MIDVNAYRRSFELIARDFRRLTEFVEPDVSNADTHSFRIYELTLRICTEFESLCKELLVEKHYVTPPKKMKISDYKTLESDLKLEEAKISLVLWNPANEFIKPFEGWSTKEPPLSWYQKYNTVKHNRNSQFSLATLDNLRYSFCGLFCSLVKANVPFQGGIHQHWVDDEVEYEYKSMPFIIRRTDDEAVASLEKGKGRLSIG